MRDYTTADLKKKTISLKNYYARRQKVSKTPAMTAKLKEYLKLKKTCDQFHSKTIKTAPFKIKSLQDHINACRTSYKYRQSTCQEEILAHKTLIVLCELESLILRAMNPLPTLKRNLSHNQSLISRHESRIEDLKIESLQVFGVILI